MLSEITDEARPLIDKLDLLRRNIEKVFVGKPDSIVQLLIGLLSKGHVLIEDVPGVGKTILARATARSIHEHLQHISSTQVLQTVRSVTGVDPRGLRATDHRPAVTEARRAALFAWDHTGRPRVEMARALGISAPAATNLVRARPERVPRALVDQVVQHLLSSAAGEGGRELNVTSRARAEREQVRERSTRS